MKSYVDSSWGRVIPIVDLPMSWMLGIILNKALFSNFVAFGEIKSGLTLLSR